MRSAMRQASEGFSKAVRETSKETEAGVFNDEVRIDESINQSVNMLIMQI
jgi:hypothetical protein